jgi:hypothetical protein
MKLKNIQQQLGALLSADQRAQTREKAAIKHLLAKLKKKERHLLAKLDDCESDEQRKKIETKIAVCHAQREKGLALLKQINSNG